ncbi:hypothetical protein [Embleya sp. MST-111070]|uniref:hypothetical protein n=1 Tax=Embleya sp. MST-111070 TaxID=3398231 RepID=UPI003F73A0B1
MLATGAPYLLGPHVRTWLSGIGWQPEANLRIGPTHFVAVGVCLPLLSALFIARAVRALHHEMRRGQVLLARLNATKAQLADAAHLAGRTDEHQCLAHELHDTTPAPDRTTPDSPAWWHALARPPQLARRHAPNRRGATAAQCGHRDAPQRRDAVGVGTMVTATLPAPTP